MLVSLNWLAEFLPSIHGIENLEGLLTDIGVEAEAAGGDAPSLESVVVARVTAVRSVKADGRTYKVCTLEAGRHGELQVVCGAPNVKRGLRAPLALVGATVAQRTVAAKSFGDARSEGMLCSEAELGLGDDSGKLLELGSKAKTGTPLAQLLETGDRVLHLSVTPNRGDWLSMHGIARELSAATGARIPRLKAKTPRRGKAGAPPAQPAQIADEALAACPKFTCLRMNGVDAQAPTPPLVLERLKRCGVRPVSAVVDFTNYVMLELGQPIHAFDHGKIEGGLEVRFGRPGERLELLDGTEAECLPHMVVVADRRGAQALGGVMGGLDSGVSGATRDLILEAAHFTPAAVRGRTRELNISSEAAFRFERGVDPHLCEIALARVAGLIAKHCGGAQGPLTVAGAAPKPPAPVTLADDRVARLTGLDIPKKLVRRRLKSLGFAVSAGRGSLLVQAPSWRFDIERAEDLVEEAIRLGGFGSLPATMPSMTGKFRPAAEKFFHLRAARQRLAQEGFCEVVTYAFVAPEWERDFYGNDQPLALANPLAHEHSVMRSGLFGGLVDRAVYNRHHRQENLRLFEIGKCFPPSGEQPLRLAALAWGAVEPERWGAGADRAQARKRSENFFDVSGVVGRLLPGAQLVWRPRSDHPALHPGKAADILIDGQAVGAAGVMHPELVDKHKYDLDPPPALVELELDKIAALPHRRHARRVSKFPLVRRDLALLVPATLPAGELVKSALTLKERYGEVIDVVVFDSYEDKDKLGTDRHVGLRIVMQGESANLVDSRINEIVDAIAGHLRAEHQVKPCV